MQPVAERLRGPAAADRLGAAGGRRFPLDTSFRASMSATRIRSSRPASSRIASASSQPVASTYPCPFAPGGSRPPRSPMFLGMKRWPRAVNPPGAVGAELGHASFRFRRTPNPRLRHWLSPLAPAEDECRETRPGPDVRNSQATSMRPGRRRLRLDATADKSAAATLDETDTSGRSPECRPLFPRRSGTVIIASLATISAIVVLSWLLLEFAHVHDRFNVNHVSGSFLALAERAREGTLYPPLSDGVSFGGTRTMPLPILIYAGAISVGGELLAPAKLVDFLASAVLLVVLVAVLRRLGAGVIMSIALASTAVATQVFLLAGTGIRPESLPTALQLGAVSLVAFSSRRWAVVLAAALCVVAILCKLSALWAPITIGLWLFAGDRRSLALFTLVFVAGTLGSLAVFNGASEGRMFTNLVDFGGAGTSVSGALRSALKTFRLLLEYAQSSFVLILIALLGLLFGTRRSRPTIFQLGLIVEVAVVVIVMADVGSDYNHLLDLVVLLPIVAFEVTKDLARRLPEARLAWTFLAVAVLVGCAASFVEDEGSAIATVIAAGVGSHEGNGQSTYDPRPLAAELGSARSVLAEDPYVALSRGERPLVIDAFMLLRIARRHPDLVAPLQAKIENGQFDAIVLLEDLQSPETISWFTDLSFGLPIYEAMKGHYRLCESKAGYFIYAPNALPCPRPES
jgi:hypothetical protein